MNTQTIVHHRSCIHLQGMRRRATASTCDAAPAYRPLTLPVPVQVSLEQPDHDAACGRVPGPHVADIPVSRGVWALSGHVGIAVCACVDGM